MNWTSEHQLIGEDEFGSGNFSDSDPADNGSAVFGHSGLTINPNCTGCLNELCIAEADYDVYRSVAFLCLGLAELIIGH